MFREFAAVLAKYWHFIAVKLAHLMARHFGSNDVNLGADISGKFEWITPEGRLNLIYNSTDLSDEEKSKFPLSSL